VLITGFHSRNYGVQYNAWLHPLTPYYKDKDGNLLPTHGQPDGISWKDWVGLLFGTPNEAKRPAQCVSRFRERRARKIGIEHPRLHVFGYDMDNMKARGWIESELPAFATNDPARIEAMSVTATNLTEAASVVAAALVFAVKSAWFARAEDAKGDLSHIKWRFWDETQEAFFRAMERVAREGTAAELDVRRGFRDPLEIAALGIFDSLCPAAGLEFADMRRLVSARHNLRGVLHGYGIFGNRLFVALDLSAPEAKSRRKKKEPAQ
jgi:CRISPR system Cascade subunit CasA